LLWAQNDNLGHHIWNEQSGLDHLLTHGALPRFGKIFVGPYDFFETATVFKKLGLNVGKTGPLFIKQRVVSGAAIYVTDLYFPKITRLRLLKHIQESETSSPASEILDKIKSYSPVVAIQLRSHGRIWKSERVQLPALVKWLKTHYPGAVIILDGFSRGRREVYDPNKLDDEWDVLPELSALWSDRVFSTKCLTVTEKAALISHCDVVVGPIGSNGVLANWLLHRPMISYGPRSYYSWTQKDTQTVPEQPCPEINYIPLSQIMDHDDNSYDFPLDQLTMLLQARLASLQSGHCL
jgi:hypothetical protein